MDPPRSFTLFSQDLRFLLKFIFSDGNMLYLTILGQILSARAPQRYKGLEHFTNLEI